MHKFTTVFERTTRILSGQYLIEIKCLYKQKVYQGFSLRRYALFCFVSDSRSVRLNDIIIWMMTFNE